MTIHTLTMPDRLLAHRKATPSVWAPFHLEEVRDDLRDAAAEAEYEDIQKSPQVWHLDFRGHADLPEGRMAARYMTTKGWSETHAFTRRGLRQFAARVLPGHGLKTLRKLSEIDEPSARLASMSMAKFIQAADTNPVRVRTYLRDTGEGEVQRTIRSVVSQGYTDYDDLTLVEALLSNSETEHLPVLAYERTDSGIRLRMAMQHLDHAPEVGEPIQMLEAWNSEVGARSVCLKGGIWTLVCTNGMATWGDKGIWRWRHAGNVQRISEGVPQAIDELRVRASGLLDLYRGALDVAIDDSLRWMEAELAGFDLSDDTRQRAIANLADSTTNAAPVNSLARVVNSLTFAAQSESDLYEQEKVEQVAGRLLTQGFSKGAFHGRLFAPTDTE